MTEPVSNQLSTMEDKYIWAEVKKHSTADDLYLVINNKVYDVTKFQHEHPYVSTISVFHEYRDAAGPTG